MKPLKASVIDRPLAAAAPAVANQSWREWVLRILINVILAAVIIATSASGLFRPIDDWLQGMRYSLLDRPPSGQVVFLDIDAASLQSVGIWPWPRSIHGALVDRLSERGAKSVAFDIDFSSASTGGNDTAFAAALKRANGTAFLGAFEQSAGAGSGTIVNTPIAELANVSRLVAVDVPLGPGNIVRDYPASRVIGGQRVSSLGGELGKTGLRGVAEREGTFGINFAINLQAIDRISAAELLAGDVAAERVRGRNVIIGASAQELRDFFVIPRFGMVPGGLIHALGAETLLQGVAMSDASVPWQLGAILLLAIIGSMLGPWVTRPVSLLGAAGIFVGLEFAALWLQREQSLRVSSAPIHIALVAFVVAGIVSDLRLRRRLHQQAASEREFTRAMLHQVIADDFDGVVIVDEAGKIMANSSFALGFLQQPAGIGGMPSLPDALAKLVNERIASARTERIRTPASGQLTVQLEGMGPRHLDYVVTMSSIDDENARLVACLTFRDVTERQAEQERLKFLASHDPLTGAWLRHELVAHVDKLVAIPGTSSTALVLIDLRNYGAVTNAHGDAIGERLLQSVLARLHARGHDMVARIGDTNFGFVVQGSANRLEPQDSEKTSPDEACSLEVVELCRSLIQFLTQPFAIGGHNIIVGVDVGAAVAAGTDASGEALLAKARIAQAATRAGGVNRYATFAPVMEEKFTKRAWIETALRQALAHNQFTLDYQPQFEIMTGKCLGAEALIRWRHPERGLISPAEFIPIAEENRLIIDIGRWAMRSACQEAAKWPKHMSVAVNISPLQFESPELVKDVHEALVGACLPPSRLAVEITEGAFVSGEVKTVALLEALRSQGIGVALDDFGTGYSSLSYLDRLPFDKIKIDQSFVKRILNDQGAVAIVQTILQLAGKLGKSVVAEGVETAAQAGLLQDMGCEAVQGYYFARPMSAADFRERFASPHNSAENASPGIRPAA